MKVFTLYRWYCLSNIQPNFIINQYFKDKKSLEIFRKEYYKNIISKKNTVILTDKIEKVLVVKYKNKYYELNHEVKLNDY